MKRALAGLLIFAAFGAEAQLAPADYCGVSVRALTMASYPSYPVTETERAPQLRRALESCPIAVAERPRNASAHEDAANALALSGDFEAAAREARAAIDLGSEEGLVVLSTLHMQGLGVPRDTALAIELLRTALKRGNALASYNMGLAHAYGLGVAQDDVDAFKHFRQSAGQRDAHAMFEVAQRYAQGRGVTRDLEEAKRWWRKGAESLAVESRRHPARWPEALPFDASGALAWLRASAAAGDPATQTFLGLLYERGVWVRQDFATALAWYRRAADQDYGKAEMQIAQMYFHGRGVERSQAESRRWGMRFIERQCEAVARANAHVAPCDRYAGDTYDPTHVGAGMATHCMPYMAARAHAACEKAVQASPGSARRRAQLARAAAHEGRGEDARKEARRAAAGGSTAAIVLLAGMDEIGYGGPKDVAAALKGYRAAAALGDERAMRHVARIYEMQGLRDSPEAREISSRLMAVSRERAQAAPDPATALLRQAQAGDARAQHNLAFHYEGERNYTQALEWYRKAAEQGHGISALNAGQMYETGQGVARDPAEALRLYRKSAEAGNAEAQWRTALLQEQLENDGEAVRWLQRLAKDGDTRGMVQLAEHYERGRGVARDMRQALALYDRAAPNNPWAQFKVGIIYFEGNGVPRDHAAALRAFRGAGDRGHAPAMNNAGLMHEQGLGTAASDSAALDWYFKALSAGSNHALGNLDVFYARGRGAPPALAEAIAWYRRGAEAGVPSARFKLAELHERPGPTQDFNEGLRWYERNVGDPRALRAAARLYRTGAVVWQPDSGNIAGRVLAAQYVADILLREAEKAEAVPRPPPPSGMATEAGEDRQRAIKIRVANTGSMQAAAMDMGWSVVVIPPPPR